MKKLAKRVHVIIATMVAAPLFVALAIFFAAILWPTMGPKIAKEWLFGPIDMFRELWEEISRN
ncbi:MAG: hypothetical protein WCO23_01345 [bacterium]